MKKNILKTLLCMFAIAAVSPDYAALAQGTKGASRSVIINNGDTIVNGKKFDELDKEERAKLRKEFKEMENNFREGSVRSEVNDVFIRRGGGDKRDVVISRNGEEPNVLVWKDGKSNDGSFNFDNKMNRDLKVFKHNGDSMFIDKNFHVFKFDGDSSMSFGFNTDSIMKRFQFKMDGLDSNLRKRVITMHRDRVPGFPGSFERIELPRRDFEYGGSSGLNTRNNSSSFNYNDTDKDGISSRMSIRVGNASKEQLKKITGAETIAKSLDVSDLTLFPNFSSGKMTLSFNINSKGTARISVLDSDMKQIFTDEPANFSGNYVKQLSLPKNGIYYVTVNQNGNWFVKRLIKE